MLAEHGLAERGPRGWRRDPACLDDVAESTGAAEIHRERAERHRQDRESWRPRLPAVRQHRYAAVTLGDGFWSMDDDEWETLLFNRLPVLGDDFVRGPPEIPAGRRDPA
jgi:hypothetical protein